MAYQIDLESYDIKVRDYIYKYPGKMAHQIQNEFRSKYAVSQSLRYLARCGHIVCINMRFYPVNQVVR
jgi:hypothetical protein